MVLTGCRQAGKTSLLVKAFGDHSYVSLDVPMIAEGAEHSGGDFLKRHQPPVIIDEVQSAPTLLRHVKADIDLHREETGRFLITGSQGLPLVEGITESLAGRFALIECKWAESPGSTHRGFSELESLVGPDRIISKTIVTPERGSRRVSERVTIADSVALEFLASP